MEKQMAFTMMLTRGVITAQEKNTAMEAAKLMDENNIGAVAILKDEKLVGIVSERDIVRRVVATGKDPQKTIVAEFMTKNVTTANFEDGLDNIYKMLCTVKFRHLPIMQNGKLVGIASQRDLLYGLKPKDIK
ncbi:MAG: CBS domain-containing protein [Candidatus Omnitrophica bacterium]|jgi:CBS domain-containing protein|nr:CBS domain-containing protein [Candidatus Omnitrophota bacterium]